MCLNTVINVVYIVSLAAQCSLDSGVLQQLLLVGQCKLEAISTIYYHNHYILAAYPTVNLE